MYLSHLRKTEIWNFGSVLRILWNEFRNYLVYFDQVFVKRQRDKGMVLLLPFFGMGQKDRPLISALISLEWDKRTVPLYLSPCFTSVPEGPQ